MTVRFSSKRPLTEEEEADVQRMIASDPDNPEVTEEQVAKARPFRDVFPDLAASIDREKARRGRPKLSSPRVAVTLRMEPAVLEAFKATGEGWRSRMEDALRRAAGIDETAG
ncbi:Uncharacterized conserved protein, DUF4415 family [Rhizobium sp. RU20A]|uniref:BrnA antitoxin family protein n=1 Tax=Rhizobium sp. RU20A TaxID=1907412 RepID=UPI0009547FB5|nr:BrnA antitoxin family protein [Rhizobium sp. RU20A]SIR28059.1 Uncharacterized conserved protein, DUF4415 family [Rhizobium sp. RU20A]